MILSFFFKLPMVKPLYTLFENLQPRSYKEFIGIVSLAFSLSIVLLFIAHNAALNEHLPGSHTTALHLAAASNHTDIVATFLAAGADATLKDAHERRQLLTTHTLSVKSSLNNISRITLNRGFLFALL